MTQFSLCKCLLGPAISHALPPLPPTSANKLSRSALKQIPPPRHYLSSGAAAEASLAYPARIMARITKGVYQQFLPMERSLKKRGEITLKALP